MTFNEIVSTPARLVWANFSATNFLLGNLTIGVDSSGRLLNYNNLAISVANSFGLFARILLLFTRALLLFSRVFLRDFISFTFVVSIYLNIVLLVVFIPKFSSLECILMLSMVIYLQSNF